MLIKTVYLQEGLCCPTSTDLIPCVTTVQDSHILICWQCLCFVLWMIIWSYYFNFILKVRIFVRHKDNAKNVIHFRNNFLYKNDNWHKKCYIITCMVSSSLYEVAINGTSVAVIKFSVYLIKFFVISLRPKSIVLVVKLMI